MFIKTLIAFDTAFINARSAHNDGQVWVGTQYLVVLSDSRYKPGYVRYKNGRVYSIYFIA